MRFGSKGFFSAILFSLSFCGTDNVLSAQNNNFTTLSLGFQQTRYLYKGSMGMAVYLDLPLSKKVSFQYSAGLGSADRGGTYVHFPVSIYILDVTYSYFGSTDPLAVLFLTMLIPEGVSVLLHSTKKTDLRMQISPLTMSRWKSNIETLKDWSPNAGATVYVKNNKGKPFLRFDGSLLYHPIRNIPAVQFSAAACIRL